MKETLKGLREKFNYSQNTIAQFLGISRQMYIKYENGDVEPPLKIIVALCGLYKVPYDVLIENKLEKTSVEEYPKVEYRIPAEKKLPLCDSGIKIPADNMYSESIIGMFIKMNYEKQLKTFAALAGIIQQIHEEMANEILATKRETDPLSKLWNISKDWHGNSNGWKWNREDLYDR